jgi:hypothetical protein
MKTLHFKRWKYSIPEEWNELDEKRLLNIIRICHRGMQDETGVLMLFKALANIPSWQFYLMRTPALMEVAEECVDFILQENTLTRNVIPVWDGFAGPSDELANLRMVEFCFTESAFIEYQHTNDQSALDRLIAVLYRPQKGILYNRKLNPEGDLRKKFNENLIGHYAKKVAKWPWEVKVAIMQYYKACRQKKIDDNDRIFNSSDGEESINGMWSVLQSVASDGPFGDIDKTAEQYVDSILMHLNEVVVKADRIEMEQNRVKVG